jgi:hypothetical protein
MMVEPSHAPAPITSDGPLPYEEAYKLILQELHSDGAECVRSTLSTSGKRSEYSRNQWQRL